VPTGAFQEPHSDKLIEDGRTRLARHRPRAQLGRQDRHEKPTRFGPLPTRPLTGGQRAATGRMPVVSPPLRSKSLKVLIPILSVIPLLRKEAGGLSASTVGRLKEAWTEEQGRCSKRDLSAKC
jgi:putative transposase